MSGTEVVPTVTCAHCSGSGVISFYNAGVPKSHACKRCGGTGKVPNMRVFQLRAVNAENRRFRSAQHSFKKGINPLVPCSYIKCRRLHRPGFYGPYCCLTCFNNAREEKEKTNAG